MDFNQNGGMSDNGLQGFLDDFPAFPGNENYGWNQPYSDQHHFYPSFEDQQSSSYHDYNHRPYQDGSHHYGHNHYQEPYQPHSEPNYYQAAPTEPASYQYHTLESHQSHSYPSEQPPQRVGQPQPPTPQPSRPTQPTPSRSDRAAPARYNPDYIHHSRTLRTPTNPYRDVSPPARPFHEEPIRELQQFTRQRFGGPLAAHAAAVVKAEAKAEAVKLAARVTSSKREETVKDVLQRQYQERKRQEEEMQLLQQQQQSFYQGLPNSFPPPLFHSRPPSHMHPSMHGPPLLPVNSHLDQPEPSATPIFTFPLVPPASSSSASASSSTGSGGVVSGGSQTPTAGDALCQLVPTPIEVAPGKDSGEEIILARQAATQASNSSSVQSQETSVESATATVVQSTASSTRKRSAEAPLDFVDQTVADKRPGVRRERNEAGEEVERLYVLVHHCNHNDPDYDPEGVLMLKEDYDRERNRDDMVCINFHSKGTPHEYVDFRVMKKSDIPPPSEAASSST